ncbi:MAG: hypothetical protein IPG53_22185 [Ignavibacteriales bacterium]|nr:hypothetical protein [Ignavibacteriales bacterium]
MKMKLYIAAVMVVALLFLNGCGDPSVDPLSFSYEPKIVVNAFIYPGEEIKDIVISRNFPLSSRLMEHFWIMIPFVKVMEQIR